VRQVAWVVAALVLLGLEPACSSTAKHADGGKITSHSADITLFFTTEIKGTLEPCGCTSDPLGDISRTAALISGVRKERPIALFDGGSALYSEVPIPDPKKAQEELTADLVAKLLPELGLAASGLGPFDLGAGPKGLRFPRQAANVGAASGLPLEAPKIVVVGGVKVGVFGLVDPATPDLGASDPTAAARTAVAGLRGEGAQIVVAVMQLKRPAARKLARDVPGIDLVLVGADAPDAPPAAAEAVGQTFLVTPANRGQVIARLDLHVDGAAGPLTDAIGPERATAEGAKLEERIAKLGKDLAGWEKDPNAEAAFVARNRADLETLKKEREELTRRPLRAPATGSWFVLRQVAIKKGLACDAAVVKDKQALDQAVGEANRAAAKDEKPVPVAAGRPHYAGVEECGYCHKAAVEFWRSSRHAKAWETLADVGKQWNRDCIGCHVTGWAEPGGATLAQNESLREVQCEVCHGPASLHVDENGKDRPRTIARAPAVDLCVNRCHTSEHSDTFQLEAYLRDVTGPGHGEAFRKKLGDGPTGHELRSAALEKAGHGLGAECPK